jgi:hypothetical protein
MSFSKPRQLNKLFGVRQRGHAHEPISFMVAIKTLELMSNPTVLIKAREYFSG